MNGEMNSLSPKDIGDLVNSIQSLTIVMEEFVNQTSLLRNEMCLFRRAYEKKNLVETELGSLESPYPSFMSCGGRD